ncbi:class I tRNA ligase family protein [Nonomuraea sp. NPDC049607]|uniref:class I tRNA ligase family protein n=1 Tax=Nonomuraea sp. NPDC049607 TaxID=3154732 RepID=UPI0034141EDD
MGRPGLPHYGHLLTGFVKDVVPRYKTMRGYRVDRRFGWDCHGLPAEMEAEKQLGLFGRANIIKYGVDRFNEFCRKSVLAYRDEWEWYITRQARWVDFEQDYKTMDLSCMESVIWAFKQLHGKGLVHQGERVLPSCWECETPQVIVQLDLVRDAAIISEGLVRDLVQQERKNLGLKVTDRIHLTLGADVALRAVVEQHRDFLAEQTLATSVEWDANALAAEQKLSDGNAVRIVVRVDGASHGARATSGPDAGPLAAPGSGR